MSAELLAYAESQLEKWGDMGHMPLVRRLVDRARDLEAEVAGWMRRAERQDVSIITLEAERDVLKKRLAGLEQYRQRDQLAQRVLRAESRADNLGRALRELNAQLHALRRDAGRYRFLREHWSGLVTERGSGGRVNGIWLREWPNSLDPESVDEAMDELMREVKP